MLAEGDTVLVETAEGTSAQAGLLAVDHAARRVVFDRYVDGGGEPVLVVGIKVSDARRIAAVNIARGVHGTTAPDPEFNADLYALLYPDSRGYDPALAYLDYVSRAVAGDARVGKSSDLARAP
jgi:hypothetical protein